MTLKDCWVWLSGNSAKEQSEQALRDVLEKDPDWIGKVKDERDFSAVRVAAWNIVHPDRTEMAQFIHLASMGSPMSAETRPECLDRLSVTVECIRSMYERANARD